MKAYSAAEKAGLKTCDYIWQINGKEVFEMSHNECVKEVKEATTMLSLNVERLAEFQEPGLGFMAVVDFATSDFETCPKYKNWANFINKSTTES